MVEVGQTLAGKLLVEGVLGRGGMGLVLVARHTILNERVAVKLLRTSDPEKPLEPNQLERFHREARAAARLKGIHVARVMDVGALDDGAPYIVMEHIDGVNLSETLKQRGPLPVEEAVDYALQACEGLAEAHAAGIVHRDLKPSNLMLTRGIDGSPLVKILDFGIAKATDGNHSTLTGSSVMLGSPSYMSPEQIRDAHEVDARSDIWSLGVTLYELLTQHLPFEAFTPAGLIARISVDPPAPPSMYLEDMPPGLEGVVMRCLEKFPEDRHESVLALAEALLPFASPLSAHAIERIRRVLQTSMALAETSHDSNPNVRMTTPRARRGTTPRAPVSSPETIQERHAISQEAHTISTDSGGPRSLPTVIARSTTSRGVPLALAALALVALPTGFFLLRASSTPATPAASPNASAPVLSVTPSAQPSATPVVTSPATNSAPERPAGEHAPVAATTEGSARPPAGKTPGPLGAPARSAAPRAGASAPAAENKPPTFATDFGERK